MNIRATTEKILAELRDMGVDRRKIEKDLAYSEKYIDQIVSRGSNKKFIAKLESYKKAILENKDPKELRRKVTHENGQPIVVNDPNSYIITKLLQNEAVTEVILETLASMIAENAAQLPKILSELNSAVANKTAVKAEQLRQAKI